MPIAVQTPFVKYTGNGVTTVFAYPFMVVVSSDISLVVDDSVKTLNVDFTVSGVGNPGGGNINFASAPSNGAVIVIRRSMELKRDTDYQQNGDLIAEILDYDFDNVIMMIQQLNAILNRALKVPIEVSTDQVISGDASTRANKLIGFDASGNMEVRSDSDLLSYVTQVDADATAAAGSAAAASAAAALVDGWVFNGNWLTGTAYAKNNIVFNGTEGSSYICLVAHTSGTFSTDLSGGKWGLLTLKGATGAGTGDLLSANNLSDVANAATARSNLSAANRGANSDITSLSGLTTALSVAQGGTGGTTQAAALAGIGALLNSNTVKSADYTVVAGDRGKFFRCSSALVLSMTAAATLGDGFAFAVKNDSSGVVTLDPNSTETIDGIATIKLTSGESCVCYSNGSAWQTLGRVHKSGCFAYQTVTTALPLGSSAAIAFNTEAYDELGWHDNATNNSRITVGESGRYVINGSVATVGATGLRAILKVNGSEIAANDSNQHDILAAACGQVSRTMRLSAGDYVELFGYSGKADTTDTSSARTFLQVERLS